MSNRGERVKRMRRAAMSGALIAGLAVIAGAPGSAVGAESDGEQARVDRPTVGPTLGLTAGLGFRSDTIHSSGLDAFSRSDTVSQSALSASYRLAGTEFSGLAVGFEWNHGTAEATARGAVASLGIDRLSLPIEARIQVLRRFCAFARVAPGALRDQARLMDTSAPADAYAGAGAGGLEQTSWTFAADVSGGLAFRFAEFRAGAASVFGLWFTAEGGYGYSGAHDLTLSSHAETQPGRVDEPVRLGRLALGGTFLRARLALSF